MTKINKIHLTIISILNLALIFIIIDLVTENDKAIVLLVFGYPILIFINAIVWLIFKILNRQVYKIYKLTTISLAILYIPTIIASLNW